MYIPEVLNQWIIGIGYILCILELEWITYKYYLTVSTNHKWSEWDKKEIMWVKDGTIIIESMYRGKLKKKDVMMF